MGMDLSDITYRIEKAFDIDLSWEEVADLARDDDITVGDLFSLLLKKIYLRDVGRYDIRLNYDLWVEIQSVLHSVTNVPTNRIELKTLLKTLFPRKTRRAQWDALRDACPYRVRKLDYPRGLRVVGFSLAAGMVLIEQFQIWKIPGANWFWPLLGLFGIWVFVETYLKVLSICAPLQICFPAGMVTVKQLCRAVLATDYMHICKNVEVPLDQRCLTAWQEFTEILVDVLGVDKDEITFRSLLVRDLGTE